MIAQSPFALMYRCFAKDFKVYAFSRRNNMPEGFTTANMADDLDAVMGAVGIKAAHISCGLLRLCNRSGMHCRK